MLAGLEEGGFARLVSQLLFVPPVSRERSELVDSAVAVWSRPGFDTFVSIPALHFEPFEHQLRAASVALRQMYGRAILADEVGLGKTIEAGIVLSELRARDLARRVLVVVPAGLVGQWREELERKFGLPTELASAGPGGPRAATAPAAAAVDEQEPHQARRPHQELQLFQEPVQPSLDDRPVVVVSLPSARREPLLGRLTGAEWDLVIVDESHLVRNPRTASSKLVRGLRSRSLLLLTATPVENGIEDLYHLVSLVRPGHLGTLAEFRKRYGAGLHRSDASTPNVASDGAPGGTGRQGRGQHSSRSDELVAELRRRLRSVMVRHRRSEVALMLPRRLAETLPVRPSEQEAALYQAVSQRVRAEGRVAGPGATMALRTALRLAGSSSRAVAPTLVRMGWADLAQAAEQVPACTKTAALAALLQRYRSSGEKVVVFTSFRATLDQLAESAAALGIPAAVYHGALGRHAKDAAIEAFQKHVDVLLSTESAGEGRNLQFCHAMVNFDLPWNPMQIEQRLGRIHRIGQDHDVVLTNLVARGTIEEHILDVLHTKLNLFELVVGELDMVLGRISDDFVFEDAVYDAHVASADDVERAGRLEEIGAALLRARAEYVGSRQWTDELVDVLEGDGAELPASGRAPRP
ncbi:MAG: DEAD/DEAH box helicase [Actinomycetota bacterium]|nr:DEAD/DEAH box helicase [Actinomycetota bacterium]